MRGTRGGFFIFFSTQIFLHRRYFRLLVKNPLYSRQRWTYLGALDVAVVLSAERPYVHRIVEIRQDGIVTMGDNNPVPDKILLTPDMKFERVCAAISLSGKRRTVANGKDGMRLFRINRFKRKIRTVSSRLWQVAERFAFWRIHAAGTVVFGSETHYYCGKIIVGRKSADGKISYHRKWKKLLFKISER